MAPLSTAPAPDAAPPSTSPEAPRRVLLIKRTARVLVWLAWSLFILFAGLILALRYAILPHIDSYRGDLEALGGRLLHQTVTIGSVSSSWQGLRPRLTLSVVQVYDSDGRVALRLPEVDATIAWSSLIVLGPRLHSLEVGAPDLLVQRDANDHLFVGGIYVDLSGGHKSGFTQWLLAQQRIVVRDAHLTWRDDLRHAPDLSLDRIGFELERVGTRHRFAVKATPDPSLADPIDVRGFFDHELFADESDATRWGGEVYASLESVDLAAWHAYLDYPIQLDRGRGSLRAWLHFSPLESRNGRLSRLPDLTCDLRLDDVVARSAPQLAQMSIASVAGRIEVREKADGDELALDNFSVLGADGLDLPALNLHARRNIDPQAHVTSGAISADRIDLETLADLLRRFPLSDAARAPLDALRPKGEVSHLAVDWRGPLDHPVAFDVSADLAGLSIASLSLTPEGAANAPGFANLTGHIKANERSGNLILHTRAATLTLPGVFDTPQLPLARLEGEFDWTFDHDDLDLSVSSLSFENADAAGAAQAHYRHGPHSGSAGPGYLDLSGHFSRVNGTRVVAYLPSGIPQSVKDYVSHAVLSGSSEDTSFAVRGALERFPFHDQTPGLARSGAVKSMATRVLGGVAPDQFHIDAHLKGVKFDYAPRPDAPPGSPPAWPQMFLPEAELIVDESRMEILAQNARVYGYTLNTVRAVLPDLDDHNQVMQAKGEGSGPLADLLQFINTSPVAGWIGHFTDNTSASGDAHLALELDMPFAHTDDTRVTGALTLEGNDVGLFGWLPALAHTTGRLDFTENGLALNDIHGDILGGSLHLSGTTRPDHVIEINGDGTLMAQGFKHLRDWPALARIDDHLDGTAHYTLAVRVPGRSVDEHNPVAHQPRVVLESNLSGLALDFPEPLKKPAPDALPLRVELTAPEGHGRDQSDQIRVSLGRLASVIVVRRADEHGALQMAQIAYGVNEPATLGDSRSYLNLNTHTLDADAWQRTISSLAGEGDSGGGGLSLFVPETIAAHVDQLHLWDKDFSGVVVGAQRTNQTWQVNVTSDQVAGRVSWRQGGLTGAQQNRVSAHLTRLVIPQSATRGVDSLLETSTSDIPALDIVADNFELSDKKLGHLELAASNTLNQGRHEWRLEKLNITNPDGALEAQGTWGTDSAQTGSGVPTHTRLNFTVTSSNVGGLLDRMGLPGTIENGTATMKGDINWRGSPLSVDYKSLAGKIHLEAARGQFLKADPGVAKLLGVLSLQGLARTLTFDFSNIFGSGFSFDSIDANASITDGILTTPDFAMKGGAAVVAIEGSVDLNAETQKLHIVVVPRLNTNAASLLFLSNPVTAIGALLASQVIEGPLSNVFRVEYNVTGPWANPVYTQIERRPLAPFQRDQSAPAAAPGATPGATPGTAPSATPATPQQAPSNSPSSPSPNPPSPSPSPGGQNGADASGRDEDASAAESPN